MNFVYSGRITVGKNVDLIIPFLYELKELTKKNIVLHLCYIQKDDHIFNSILTQSLIYDIPIVDYENLGVNWTKKLKLPNKILINLSTFSFEDFNVSTAQADQENWPLLLSHWGPFGEIELNSVGYISITEIISMQSGNFDFPQNFLKNLLSKLSNNVNLSNKEVKYNASSPLPIDGKHISRKILERQKIFSKMDDLSSENFFKQLYFNALVL